MKNYERTSSRGLQNCAKIGRLLRLSVKDDADSKLLVHSFMTNGWIE